MTTRYEPLLLLGTGGMASVHVGRLRGADGFSRLVALKRAHSHVKDDQSLADTMRTEAWLASRLHHTNVVSILDVEDDNGDLVLVLDYVEGCTLSNLLAKLPVPHPREMVRVILDVAAGLHAAHLATDEEGKLLDLVHRDVSPSNVLVGTDGVARVSDFGIAKAQFHGREMTETGLLKGKASYMAPEYVLHQRAGPASDLFSLGIVAWEALTGVRLFKGVTEMDALNRIVSATVHPMAEHHRMLAPLDDVVLRALSRLPEDRQTSVDEFAAELAAVARKHDLLGSYTEVSELVEHEAGAELQERRRDLARTALSYVGTVPVDPSEGRDAEPTRALGRDDETETNKATLPLIVEPGLVEPRPPRMAELPAIAPPLPPAAFRRENEPVASGREKLGLLAGLSLLALAVGALFVKIRGEDGVPAATGPSVSAPSLSAPSLSAPSLSAPSVSAASVTPTIVASAPPIVTSAAPAVSEEPVVEEVIELDASAPKPVLRPVHRRTYPAAAPALMPRKAPPNPYAPAPK